MNQDGDDLAHQSVSEPSNADSSSAAKVQSIFPAVPKDATSDWQTVSKVGISNTRSPASKQEAVAAAHDDSTSDLEKIGRAPPESVLPPNKGNQVTMPEDLDVVFGRGKPFQLHPGNQRLHMIVDRHRDRYQAARRYDKFAIAEEIVETIKSGGKTRGRFLRRVEGEEFWEVVPDDVAREKVAHALRGKYKPSEGHDEAPSTVKKRRASILGATQTIHPRSQQLGAMPSFGQGNPLTVSSPTGFLGSLSAQHPISSPFDTGVMPQSWNVVRGMPSNLVWPQAISSLLDAQRQYQYEQRTNNPITGLPNLSGGIFDYREMLRHELSSANLSLNSSVPSRIFEIMGMGSSSLASPSSMNIFDRSSSLMMQTAATSATANTPITATNINWDVAMAVLAQDQAIVRRRAAIERALRRDPPTGGTYGASIRDADAEQNQPRFPRFF